MTPEHKLCVHVLLVGASSRKATACRPVALLILAQPQTPLPWGQLKMHYSHSLDVEQCTVLMCGGLSVVTIVTADDVRVLDRLAQPRFQHTGALQRRCDAYFLSTRL